jgi:hypothetical protein
MSVVMIQRGAANGAPLPNDGEYLASFDFEAHDGQGEVALTPFIASAKRFDTAVDAFVFIKTVPECKPLRPDGRPNRPLTAANWEIKNAD